MELPPGEVHNYVFEELDKEVIDRLAAANYRCRVQFMYWREHPDLSDIPTAPIPGVPQRDRPVSPVSETDRQKIPGLTAGSIFSKNTVAESDLLGPITHSQGKQEGTPRTSINRTKYAKTVWPSLVMSQRKSQILLRRQTSMRNFIAHSVIASSSPLQ